MLEILEIDIRRYAMETIITTIILLFIGWCVVEVYAELFGDIIKRLRK